MKRPCAPSLYGALEARSPRWRGGDRGLEMRNPEMIWHPQANAKSKKTFPINENTIIITIVIIRLDNAEKS